MAILSLGLVACASQNTPTSQQYDPMLLVGQWNCSVSFQDDVKYHYRIDYQANGTSRDKGIFSIQLDKNVRDLVWRFEIQTQSKWRMDGQYLFEQEIAQPKVRILSPEAKSARLLKKFEKNHPDMVRRKKEMLKSLSQLDNEEIKSKILILNDKIFQDESEIEGTKFVTTCQRI